MAYPRVYGVDAEGEAFPVRFPDAAMVQSGDGWQRLAMTTSSSPIDLIVELLGEHPGPFRFLFILVVSRGTHPRGRYALDESLERWQLLSLLEKHRELFEQDGRHQIWVGTADNAVNLVYDQHDVLYAYGDVDRWLVMLRGRGFGLELPALPSPHQHAYHEEFDESVRTLLSGHPWHHSPLQEGDDS